MDYVTLGDTGKKVSRIGLGTWAIGGWLWGGTDEAQAVAAIQAAVDRGITLIDTAPVYGQGKAEQLVGRAIAEQGSRERVVLATKVGLEWSDKKVFRNATSERIERELDDSLRRLRVDVIDLYQVHWPDRLVPVEETAAALLRAYEQGKIRAIGVSNYSKEQMQLFAQAAPLHSVQPPYNLFERGAEREVLPHAAEHGVTTICYGVLCRGLLSGKVTLERRYTGDDLRRFDPKFRKKRLVRYLAAVQRLDSLARERYDKDVLALAVRWALQQPGVGTVLWGVRRPEQLAPVDDIFGWTLDDEALGAIEAIVAAEVGEPVGPEFMAPGFRA